MIHSPVIVIGCARSGTTLLFNILSEAPELDSIGHESGEIIEKWHHPSGKEWVSGELTAEDLTAASRTGIVAAFESQAASGHFWRRVNDVRAKVRNAKLWQKVRRRGQMHGTGAATSSAIPRQGLGIIRRLVWLRNTLRIRSNGRTIRLLEKTPENCLRLPFLLALFPDASIVHLVRDGRSNVNSLMEGWKHPHLFHGYKPPLQLEIPGNGQPKMWAFTLIPGWTELVSAPLEVVCAYQWIRCNEAVLAYHAETKGRVPFLQIRYEELVRDPSATLRQITDFAGLDFEKNIARYAFSLPQINVVSAPRREKWREQNQEPVIRILPLIRPLMERLDYASP